METLTINQALLRSLLVLADVIEARDGCTGGHTWRVSQYARRLAERAGLDHDYVLITYLGALVHDIGKIGIADQVLNKPGALNAEEQALMRKHPLIGHALVRDHPLAPVVGHVVLQHHERFDGAGYPHGAAGQEIALSARIVSLADVFDALTSPRPYRRGMPPEQALALIEQGAGSQFDLELARLFVEQGRAGAFEHILGHCAEQRMMLSCSGCGPVIVQPHDLAPEHALVCPVCKGRFVVLNGSTLQIAWDQTYDHAYTPAPNEVAIGQVLAAVPGVLRLAA